VYPRRAYADPVVIVGIERNSFAHLQATRVPALLCRPRSSKRHSKRLRASDVERSSGGLQLSCIEQ
jgi:hypothetical protein